ncbi:MAG: hypothetical protein GY895_10365 [Phycisphaera sp.]|nr:hypothetical protein [Phycisphaera sp.]
MDDRLRGASDELAIHGSPPRFDQPLSWSVPLLRLGDTTIRAHASLLAVVVVVLVRAAWRTGDKAFLLGPWLAGVFLAALLFVVVLHEMATWIVSRKLGGDLPEIVLQPLGGLDEGVPPRSWRRCVLVAFAGPLAVLSISVAAAVVLSIAATPAGGMPILSISGLYSPSLASSGWLEATFMLGQVALVIAAVNLLPAAPFRGRLLLEALLRPQVGRRMAVSITRRVGIVVAIVLFVVGVVTLSLPIVLVAGLCAASIQRHGRYERVSESLRGVQDDDFESVETGVAMEDPATSFDEEAVFEMISGSEDEPAASEAVEEDGLDRILRKISSEGIESLDPEERRILEQATRRRREDP